MKINGLEELQAKLKSNVTLDHVKTVVQVNGDELNNKMKRQTTAAFVMGYSTGDTARSINTVFSDGGLTATVAPGTDYSMYVEWGTRFMAAEPFVRPAFDAQKTIFINDLKKLCE